jgi:hypothetical protein
MSFVRPGWAGESLRFSAEFFGITMSYHPKVSMIIIQKNRAANRGNPVVDLYDAAGRQSVGLCSLGNDFYRPTSFGSVARPSTMTPTATFGSLATTPADTLERCCTPSGNNSGLTLRAPGTSARTSAFVGRGIQSPYRPWFALPAPHHAPSCRSPQSQIVEFWPRRCLCMYAIIRLHSRFRIK